jgi:hypothetical protein
MRREEFQSSDAVRKEAWTDASIARDAFMKGSAKLAEVDVQGRSRPI